MRTIFATYLELGSGHALQRWLDARGILSKVHVTRTGRTSGGRRFSRGALFHLLRNRIYIGTISHRGVCHEGMHPAIVDPDLFEAVQASLDANARRHAGCRDRRVARAPLTGRLFDADGQPMSPTFAYGRSGKIYRYYVSAPLQQGERRRAGDAAIRRVSADALLRGVVNRIAPAHASESLDLLAQVEIHASSLQLLMPVRHLPAARSRGAEGEHVETDPVDPSRLRLTIPVRARFHGGRTVITAGAEPAARPDDALIRALRTAHAMVARDKAGRPVLELAPESPYRRRLVRLAFLAPDLQRAILAGRQPPSLSLNRIMEGRLPLLWSEQAEALGAARGS